MNPKGGSREIIFLWAVVHQSPTRRANTQSTGSPGGSFMIMSTRDLVPILCTYRGRMVSVAVGLLVGPAHLLIIEEERLHASP
jgi:hypothetical protein